MNRTHVAVTISTRGFYLKVLKTHHSQHRSYDPEVGLLARWATSNGPLGNSNSRGRLRKDGPPVVEPVQQGHRKRERDPRTHSCPMPIEGEFRSEKCWLRAAGEERRTQAAHTFPDKITSTISLVESLCTFSGSSPRLSRLNVL